MKQKIVHSKQPNEGPEPLKFSTKPNQTESKPNLFT